MKNSSAQQWMFWFLNGNSRAYRRVTSHESPAFSVLTGSVRHVSPAYRSVQFSQLVAFTAACFHETCVLCILWVPDSCLLLRFCLWSSSCHFPTRARHAYQEPTSARGVLHRSCSSWRTAAEKHHAGRPSAWSHFAGWDHRHLLTWFAQRVPTSLRSGLRLSAHHSDEDRMDSGNLIMMQLAWVVVQESDKWYT